MTHTTAERIFDLVGFGIAAVDELIELAAFPEPGSKVHVLAAQRQGGGLCTTALVAAARLGLRCCYGGALGDNDLSDYTREALHREGIEISNGTPHPDARPFHSIILIDRSSGERTILASPAGVVPLAPEDVREDLIRSSRALFVDHLGPAGTAHACRIARHYGVPSVADIERVDAEVAGVFDLIDHLIVPLHIAQEHTGRAAPEAALEALAKTPRPCTAVTDGVRGCWFTEGGTIQHQAAFRVDVVDTTGCGDVFHGGYAAAIVWGQSVAEAIRFAAAAAALKATRPGAQAGAPTRASLEQFLSANEGGSPA